MRISIQKSFAEIKNDLASGTINKQEAKERLEGVLLLAKIELEGQPFFDSVYSPALTAAKEILNQEA